MFELCVLLIFVGLELFDSLGLIEDVVEVVCVVF